MPRLSKASAALNPPMPAPMTRTCFDVLMAIFAPKEFPPRLIQRRAVIAGHSASEDARRRAYDPATHLLRNKLIAKTDGPAGDEWPAQHSLRRYPGCFHHRGPARNLRRDKGGEIPRRANSKLEAELFHAGHHLGRLQRRVDRGVELVDDVGGSCGRRLHPGPEFEREFVEPELPHGGHVGQIGLAFLARYGQRLDPALAN